MITRPMTATDRRFVVPTWARSARYKLPLSEQFRVVDRVLDGGATVLCLATDERTVHAWLAFSGDVLAFAYTAPELRRNGFVGRLMREAFGERGPAMSSHPLPAWLAPRCRHNPFLIASAMLAREAA